MTTTAQSWRSAPGYRWVVLALSWAAFTATSADRAAWGPSSAAVGHQLGVSLAQIGVFATAYYLGHVVSTAAGGLVADWLGSRVVLSASLVLSGGFMIAFGSVATFTQGLIVQGLVGLTAGAGLAAGAKAISGWFRPERRGFAMGLYMSATSVGLVIANAVIPSLIVASGWRPSYLIFGSFSIVIGVLCALLVRPGTTEASSAARRFPDLRPLLHNRKLLLLGLAGLGGLWGTNGLIAWANLLMVSGADVRPVRAGVVVVVIGATAILAKPICGALSDATGVSKRLLVIWVFAAFGVTLIAFGLTRSITGFFLMAPVLGVVAFVYSPLLMAMISELTQGTLSGSAFGLLNAFWLLGSVAVPPVVGLVFQETHSFAAAFVTLAAGPLLAVIPMVAMGRTRSHPTGALDQASQTLVTT